MNIDDWQPEMSHWSAIDLPGGAPQGLASVRPVIRGYTVLDRLGEGGMGEVWRAVQQSTRRVVALKVLKTGSILSEEARAQFDREIRLAARLEHPNIGRVYDGGLLDGVCFYVMEYVDGLPLDEYCRSNRLGLREILRLVIGVCRAVHHAHLHGVIHRDLKPSNILVTADGQPHLLDFGLARSMNEGDREAIDSDPIAFAGTPRYCAPEQAAGRQGNLDARSDVFALGAILFELLTGHAVHDVEGDKSLVRQRIAEVAFTWPRELRSACPGELRSVIGKALMLEPAHRYQSVAALADDLSRFLAGEPVTARPLTAGYVLRKRLARHRLVSTLTAAALVVLLATATYSHLEIARQRDVAAQKAEALREGLYLNNVILAESRLHQNDMEGALASLAACPTELRHWEWHWLRDQADRSDLVIETGVQRVCRLAVDDANQRAVILGAAGELAIVHPQTGQVLERLSLDEMSVDGRRAMSANGQLVAWSKRNGSAVHYFDTLSHRTRSITTDRPVGDIAVSCDGRYLSVLDGEGNLSVWDVTETPTCVRNLSLAPGVGMSWDQHRDERLVTFSDEQFWIIDASEKNPPRQIDHRIRQAGLLAVAGDQVLLASLSNCLLRLDLTDESVDMLGYLAHPPSSMTFGVDMQHLWVSDPDGSIECWDIPSGVVMSRWAGHSHGSRISLATRPGGCPLLSCSDDGVLRIWPKDQATHGQLVYHLPASGNVSSVDSAAFVPLVVLGTVDGQVILIRPDGDNAEPESFALPSGITAVAVAAEGNRIVVGCIDSTIHLVDPLTGRNTMIVKLETGVADAIRLTADGSFAAVSASGRMVVLDLTTGRDILTKPAWQPFAWLNRQTGYSLITAEDQRLQIQPVAGGIDETRLLRGENPINLIRCDLAGRRILTGTSDGLIMIHEAQTGQTISRIGPIDRPVFEPAVAISIDGRRVLTAGAEVTLWDANSGSRILALPIPEFTMTALRATGFSGNDRFIYAVSSDSIRFWRSR
jgi:WD40 repeat protein